MIHRFSQSSDISANSFSNRSDIEQNNPLIQVHDDNSSDHVLSDSIANEMINISGAEVLVYLRTDNYDYDDVWEEDPDPTYKPSVMVKGFFVPKPKNSELTIFGVDTPNQTTIMFSKSQILNLFGDRLIRAGDIIELPYNGGGYAKPSKFRVINSYDSGNFKYKWYYWSCLVENIVDDVVVDIDND